MGFSGYSGLVWTSDEMSPVVGVSGNAGSNIQASLINLANAIINAKSAPLISNIVTLRGLGVAQYPYVIVAGYSSADDGGGGTFTWQNGSFTDNGGTIIIPGGSVGTTTSTGAWIRAMVSGYVDVRWFGAIANGTNDCTTALQQALSLGGHIYVPNVGANYIVSRSLIIYSNTIFEIDGYIQQAPGTNQIVIRNSNIIWSSPTNQNITICGHGTIDGNSANNVGTEYFTGGDWTSDPITNTGTSGTTLGTNKPIGGVCAVISLIGLTNFTIKDITIIGPIRFCLQLDACSNGLIENTIMQSPKNPNHAACVQSTATHNIKYINNNLSSSDDGFTIATDWTNSAPWNGYGNGGGGSGPCQGNPVLGDTYDIRYENNYTNITTCDYKISPGGISGYSGTGNVYRINIVNPCTSSDTAKLANLFIAQVPDQENGSHILTGGTAAEIQLDTPMMWYPSGTGCGNGAILLGNSSAGCPGTTIRGLTISSPKLGNNTITEPFIITESATGNPNSIVDVTIDGMTIDLAQPIPTVVFCNSGAPIQTLKITNSKLLGNTGWYSGPSPLNNPPLIDDQAGILEIILDDLTASQFSMIYKSDGVGTGTTNISLSNCHLTDVVTTFAMAPPMSTHTTNITISGSCFNSDNSGVGELLMLTWGSGTGHTIRINAAALSFNSVVGSPILSTAGFIYNAGSANLSLTGTCVLVDGTQLTPYVYDQINSVTSNSATKLSVGLNVCTNSVGPIWGNFIGVSGYSGYSGVAGSTGNSGYSGYSGASGTSGYSGSSLTTNAMTASSGTITPICNAVNTYTVVGTTTVAAPGATSPPVLIVELTQDSTGGRTINWASSYVLSTTLPTVSTAASSRSVWGFVYNPPATKWDCAGVCQVSP